jgi:hypothetical protein
MFRVVKNTRRNRRSPSPQATEESVEKSMTTFFDAESAHALHKPWLRLERGLRLQRFRAFADVYPGLSDVEKDTLYRTLVKANDAKLLNTKQQIQYENGNILAVRGLKMVRLGDSPATFKIEVVRPTKRKSKEDEKEEEEYDVEKN